MMLPGLPFGLIGKKPLEYVGGVGRFRNTAGSTTWSVDITGLSGGLASAPEAGDFVVALVSSPFQSGRTVSTAASGWNRLVNGTTRNSYGLFVKRLTTAETAFTVSYGSSVTQNSAVIHVWRNTNPDNPIDATTTVAGASTGNANSPSITTVTPNAVVLAMCTNSGSAITAPSGMDNFVSDLIFGENYSGAASIFRRSAGSYDPPAFGGTSAPWDAVTVALRPR